MTKEFWNNEFKQNPDHVNVVDHVLEEELRNLTPGKALDLGCGSGVNAFVLARKGWSVTGVDWSERAVKIANKEALKEQLDARFIEADVTTWKSDDKYNLVISTFALPDGDGWKKTLATAKKALAPGGTLIVEEWDKSMNDIWGMKDFIEFSLEDIVDALKGLNIEKAEVLVFNDMFSDSDDLRGKQSRQGRVAFVRAKNLSTI